MPKTAIRLPLLSDNLKIQRIEFQLTLNTLILLFACQASADYIPNTPLPCSLLLAHMDDKAPSADTMVDVAIQIKSESDFLSQAGQARAALEQLSSVLGMKNPSDNLIIAALDQIMKTIVSPPILSNFLGANNITSFHSTASSNLSIISSLQSSHSLRSTPLLTAAASTPVFRCQTTLSGWKAFALVSRNTSRSLLVQRKVKHLFILLENLAHPFLQLLAAIAAANLRPPKIKKNAAARNASNGVSLLFHRLVSAGSTS
jgi:hypothetical protein